MNVNMAGEMVVIPLSYLRELLAPRDVPQQIAPLARMATQEEAIADLRVQHAPVPNGPVLSIPNLNAPVGFVPTRPETLRKLAENAASDDGRNVA